MMKKNNIYNNNKSCNYMLCDFFNISNEWDNKRLTKYSIEQDYYLNFTYNVNGLRTSKVIVDNYAESVIKI